MKPSPQNRVTSLALLITFGVAAELLADGVNNNVAGGRNRALGGATVADPQDALNAMAANPAGLAGLDRSLTAGLVGIYADLRYAKDGSAPVGLTDDRGLAPEFAIAIPFEERFTLGLSLVPEQIQRVEWRYRDAPGGLDGNTSYGVLDHSAEFIGLRSAVGLGARVSQRLSLGASAGLNYQQIRLDAPYIFQAHPQLRGVKADLDLDTEGVGFNGELGLIYRASERLQLGMRYRTKTELSTSGDADGDAGAQLRSLGVNADGNYHYDAEIETALPRSISGGFSWQALDRVRLLGQVEWVNWSDSFDHLTVKLSDGSNATINSVGGDEDLVDFVPLDWEDRFVYRMGLEFEPVEDIFLRVGYSYGKNPIPSRTLTPLNAAIGEHALSVGLGFMLGRTTIDLSYQYDLRNSVRVGRSKILDGEYSDSSVDYEAHWLGISATVPF